MPRLSISAINPSPLLKFFVCRLPGRTKRMVFMSSLASIAQDKTKKDKEFIQKLNNLLQLSTFSDNALKLPMHISSIIWSNKQILEQEINQLTQCTQADEKAHESALRIVESTPEWLLGNNPTAAIKDIIALFTKDGSPFAVELQGA